MHGKTVLITGATSGIGKHAAIGIARQGARVVLTTRDAGPVMRALFGFFGRSPLKGARGLVHLACSPDIAGVTGAYFSGIKIAHGSALSLDMRAAQRLWDIACGYVGI